MKKHNLLIVESNPADLDRVLEIFQGHEENFECRVAASTGSAGWLLRRERIDVILLSATPFGVSGLDFLAEVRRRNATKNVPVIFYSARESMEEELKAYEAGADVYESGRLDPERIRAHVSRLTRRWRFQWPHLGFKSIQFSMSPAELVGTLAASMFVIRLIDTVVR